MRACLSFLAPIAASQPPRAAAASRELGRSGRLSLPFRRVESLNDTARPPKAGVRPPTTRSTYLRDRDPCLLVTERLAEPEVSGVQGPESLPSARNTCCQVTVLRNQIPLASVPAQVLMQNTQLALHAGA